MSRSRIDLDLYQDEILELYRINHTSSDIANYLKRSHDVIVTSRTIERRLSC